jgi:hypothetical protein
MKKNIFIATFCVASLGLLINSGMTKGKKTHPYDVFTAEIHEMHSEGFFEGVIKCEVCHVTDDSYERGARKVNRLGCHLCHNPPAGQAPLLEGPNTCTLCHIGGQFPKPKSHLTDWVTKHQSYAKSAPQSCSQCHANKSFCLDCHKKRDTVKKKSHRRNFKFYHSIEARANPRRCDTCHTPNYCQTCHAGRGSSKR